MKNILLFLIILTSNTLFAQEVSDQALMTNEAEKIIETANARIVKSDTLVEFQTKEIQDDGDPIIDYKWKTITHYDSENRLVMKEQKMLSDPPYSVTVSPSLAVWDEHNNYVLECNNDRYGKTWAILKYDDKDVLLEKKFWNEKIIAKMVSDNPKKEEIKRTEEIKGNNEIKTNLLYSALSFPEINYERVIKNHTAVGITANVYTDQSATDAFRYMVATYLRYYFGKKKAAGFFMEVNSALVGQEKDIYDPATRRETWLGYSYTIIGTDNSPNLGLGAAMGAKFINKLGYLMEIMIGGGGLFETPNTFMTTVYPRIGLSLGKRF